MPFSLELVKLILLVLMILRGGNNLEGYQMQLPECLKEKPGARDMAEWAVSLVWQTGSPQLTLQHCTYQGLVVRACDPSFWRWKQGIRNPKSSLAEGCVQGQPGMHETHTDRQRDRDRHTVIDWDKNRHRHIHTWERGGLGDGGQRPWGMQTQANRHQGFSAVHSPRKRQGSTHPQSRGRSAALPAMVSLTETWENNFSHFKTVSLW